jgi:hypothetical protein
MKQRRGRINLTQFVDSEKIRKIAVVREGKRPLRLKKEGWALERARIIGINTPAVFDYSINAQSQEVLTLARIDGKNIWHYSHEEKCECLYSVGRQMMLLKSPIPGFGWIDLDQQRGSNNDWQSFLQMYAEAYGGNIVADGLASKEDLKLTLRALSKIDADIPGSFIVNRDIKPGNIIRDSRGATWIIDWENAILGDPLYDLAIFGGNYGHGNLWRHLRDGYGLVFSHNKYLVYQIIALFGTIDFCVKYRATFRARYERLRIALHELQGYYEVE